MTGVVFRPADLPSLLLALLRVAYVDGGDVYHARLIDIAARDSQGLCLVRLGIDGKDNDHSFVDVFECKW